jgi:hypothetical protein
LLSLGSVDNLSTDKDSAKTNLHRKLNYPLLGTGIKNLFYIQRTTNINTIVYELNTKSNGKPDPDEPVHVYWIKYAEHGQKEELSYIQRKFAYGLTSTTRDNDKFDIRFVSYKKIPLALMKTSDGKYHIFASIAQKQILLNRIFIKIDGGSFWIPNVVYVEMNGTDPLTGREIMERFKP